MPPSGVEAALQAGSRKLGFAPSVSRTTRLLEVNDHIMEEVMKGNVCFKGGETGTAVLCTSEKTFSVQVVETTNSLYLVPPIADCSASQAVSSSQENLGLNAGLATQVAADSAANARPTLLITDRADAHLECVEVRPKFGALDEALAQRPWAGADAESAGMEVDGEASGLYTFEELTERVQASEAQLRAALEARGAFQHDRHWRVMASAYETQLVTLALACMAEAGWQLGEVPGDALAEAMVDAGHERMEVEHLLKRFATKLTEEGDSWRMEPAKVGRTVARGLLEQRSQKGWPLPEFFEAWRQELPDEWSGELAVTMLKGLGLVDSSAGTIKLFCITDLPSEPESRFAALFAERATWEMTDLEPYLEGMDAPGVSAEAMLLKYARAAQTFPDQPIRYSNRF